MLPASGTSGYQAWPVDGLVVVNPHFGVDAGGGILDLGTGVWSALPPHRDVSWNGDMAGVIGRDDLVLGDSGRWLLDLTTLAWVEIPPRDSDTSLDLQRVPIGRSFFTIGGGDWDSLAVDSWLWTAPR